MCISVIDKVTYLASGCQVLPQFLCMYPLRILEATAMFDYLFNNLRAPIWSAGMWSKIKEYK